MKIFRLLARVRFWKHRALKAEQRVSDLIERFAIEIQELKESNEAERWRNMSREDELITVPARLGGLWGMPARTGPARPKQVNQPPQLAKPSDPWEALSWAEKQEFEMFWKGDAEAANVPEHIARQQFMATIAERKVPIHDEPFS